MISTNDFPNCPLPDEDGQIDREEAARDAKVRAVNSAHKRANQLSRQLIEFFGKYLGEKILKVDGDLLKAIEDELKATTIPMECGPYHGPGPRNGVFSVIRDRTGMGLRWTVRSCEDVMALEGGGTSCLYYECTVDVGEIGGEFTDWRHDGTNQYLKKLAAPAKYRTTFTSDGVLKARKRYEKAQAALDRARSGLYPFGERDT